MEPYLKSHQHYADLYDRFTVERCRRSEEFFKKEKDEKELPEGVTKEQNAAIRNFALEWSLHMEAGERYLNRDKTIREWMDSDRKKDELYESAQPPEDVRCLTCRNRLKVTWKDLWSRNGKEDRVLFMFDCPNKCLPRRAFFNDGEEWRTEPDPCLKCGKPLTKTSEEKTDGYVVISTCSSCGNIERQEHEWFKPKEEEIDPNFAQDRDRFCLTEEKGREYQDEKYRMEGLSKFMEEWKEEDERRKKKLEENPKGFHLEGRFSCIICHAGTPEGDNWYDEYGIKCLVCQKAIDEREIPPTVASDKESWYSKYDLEDRFSLKGATLRKWIKDGLIKPRTISVYGKGSHYELFLIEDNEGFLPPKNMVESKPVREKKNGKIWTHHEPWYRFVDPFEHLKDYSIIKHMRTVSEEEIKQREEEKAQKQKAKAERRERLREIRLKKGIKISPRKKT